MQKVMVLEKSERKGKSSARVLSKHAYIVDKVMDAKTILERIKSSQPDMIVLDLAVSKLDGIKLLQTLRELNPEIPVVVLTAKIKEGHEAVNLGAKDYIKKPIDEEELEERVGRILEVSARLLAATTSQSGERKKVGSILAPSTEQRGAGFSIRLKELHDEKNGRIDAAKVADFLGVPLAQLAAALGAKYAAVHKTPSAPSLQEGLSSIKRSLEILTELISDPADIRAWLNCPHPDLDDKSPIQVILEGNAGALRTILENSILGIPT